ncbi:hypothetical protein [Paenirhodobacter sp.]|uniref:hypothetical protein n=1 Tax=Paenirhodobacter sp. TaxID=1965326 RepID=UPI003B3DFA4F
MKIAKAGLIVLIAAVAVSGCMKRSKSRDGAPPTIVGATVDPTKPLLEQPLAGESRLGETVATLGDPTQPGFWLRTPLVSKETKGRVVNDKTGASVQVDLLPTGGEQGVGSMLSLASMRLLGGSLTDLPELTVFALN